MIGCPGRSTAKRTRLAKVGQPPINGPQSMGEAIMTAMNGSVNPCAPVAASSTAADLPAVPEVFAAIEGALRAYMSGQHRTQDADQLYHWICKDLHHLSEVYAHEYGRPYTAAPSRERLTAAILRLGSRGSLESEAGEVVSRWCIARRAGMLQEAATLEETAWGQYCFRTDDFTRVLGGMVREEFGERARRHEARVAYHQGTNLSAADDWAVYKESSEGEADNPPGLVTGLASVDAALGGLRGIAILGGITGVGKSTWALTSAAAALRAHDDLIVVYYLLDTFTKRRLYDRLLCYEAGVTYATLQKPSKPETVVQELARAEQRLLLEVLPWICIFDRSHQAGRDRFTSKALLEDYWTRMGAMNARRALVVIDYFGRLPVPDRITSTQEADQYRLDLLLNFQSGTRSIANPEGATILVLAEVPKDAGSTDLRPKDLLGTVALGYTAESILFLEPEPNQRPVEPDRVPVNLNIAKGRDGVTRTTIPLWFDHAKSRFRERSQANPGGVSSGASLPRRAASRSANRERIDPLGGCRED